MMITWMKILSRFSIFGSQVGIFLSIEGSEMENISFHGHYPRHVESLLQNIPSVAWQADYL